MSGRRSRDKGARGEREIIAIHQPIVDDVCREVGQVRLELQRDTRQRYQAKNYDVIGIPWMAMEVKRVENQSGLGSWWRQTLAATREGQTPVLFYRVNYAGWMVRARLPISVVKGGIRVWMTVTMDMEDWLVYFRVRLKAELTKIT